MILGGASSGIAAQENKISATNGVAPFIDSKAIRERYSSITPADMEMLRSKRILLASRSFGLCICDGLVGESNSLLGNVTLYPGATGFKAGAYERFDVFKVGGKLDIIPPDIFKTRHFVHFLCTIDPYDKRVDEVATLLKDSSHHFATEVDAVMIEYHQCTVKAFDAYASKMDALRREFPRIRFIYTTAGFMGPKYAKENEESHLFSEKVRQVYKGKVPLYDMGAILSDDFRVGHVYCPEYSKDPAELHPNMPAGRSALARGFLLVLRDSFRMPDEVQSQPKVEAVQPIQIPSKVAVLPQIPVQPKVEALPPPPLGIPASNPEYKAVRAILDANGLKEKTVESLAIVRDGHIVELRLQEGGIREIPDAIGVLTSLESLHVYGDPRQSLPLLIKISPAIGKCTQLRDLLLNDNNLCMLPVEITGLQNLQSFSIANNHLAYLSPVLLAWVKKFDPKGLESQHPL